MCIITQRYRNICVDTLSYMGQLGLQIRSHVRSFLIPVVGTENRHCVNMFVMTEAQCRSAFEAV